MKINEMVQETVESGISPLTLSYSKVSYFDSEKNILRTTLEINSLDLGVLTQAEYRYVARRSKKGDDLTARQIEKIFENSEKIFSEHDCECITIPLYPKTLLSGRAQELFFEAFARYPVVSPQRICAEISADILYEDLDLVKQKLKELKDIGISLAVFEVGDEFCPVFRLADMGFTYAFADQYVSTLLEGALPEDEASLQKAAALPQLLHLYQMQVFTDPCDPLTHAKAKAAGFDGVCFPYSSSRRDPEEEPLEEELFEEEPAQAEEDPAQNSREVTADGTESKQ